MRALALGMAMSLMALGASAQTTNTNCYTSYGQTSCRSTTQPNPWATYDPDAYSRAYQNGWNQTQQTMDAISRARQQKALAEQQRQAQVADAERAERARQAGAMIAAGNCADAKKYALNAGDFDLAGKVEAACTP